MLFLKPLQFFQSAVKQESGAISGFQRRIVKRIDDIMPGILSADLKYHAVGDLLRRYKFHLPGRGDRFEFAF